MKGLKDNTIKSVWTWFFETLKPIYTENELKSIRRILFEHFFHITEKDIILEKQIRLTETDIVRVIKAIKKLENQVPIQYITGKAYFLEYVFDVNSDVLIPRPETEELVIFALNRINSNLGGHENIKILDIGTGSGCIAIAMANKIPTSVVTAIDKSKEALDIALVNSKKYGDKVTFVEFDIFDNSQMLDEYDVILSNPPYVLESEKEFMQRNVLEYEPESALFVFDNDPLVFYDEIISKAKSGWLKKNGLLLFEINEKFSNHIADLFHRYGFVDVHINKDIHNKPRFVSGILKA
ncbi:MAG: peptide chain release factor N(5)-glutamine methyltransferase [Bacteroidetes bacterium]|nr:peptide chain release factor N(5)-glutamine methyltransferase [Bacteroidota bacterium]